jgi:hypothetical protein
VCAGIGGIGGGAGAGCICAICCGGKSPADYKMEAVAAWRRFLACVQALPADQAQSLWQMVYQTKAMPDAA